MTPMRVRQTIADRVAIAAATPVDPIDLVSEGAMTIADAAAFTGYSMA